MVFHRPRLLQSRKGRTVSNLTQLAAILAQITPHGVTDLRVSRSVGERVTYAVTMHWRAGDGLQACAIEDGPTVTAAYNAANLKRLLLIADERKAVALRAEREGVN